MEGDIRLSLHRQTPIQLQRIKRTSQPLRQQRNEVHVPVSILPVCAAGIRAAADARRAQRRRALRVPGVANWRCVGDARRRA